jgi:hypothetical protein
MKATEGQYFCIANVTIVNIQYDHSSIIRELREENKRLSGHFRKCYITVSILDYGFIIRLVKGLLLLYIIVNLMILLFLDMDDVSMMLMYTHSSLIFIYILLSWLYLGFMNIMYVIQHIN